MWPSRQHACRVGAGSFCLTFCLFTVMVEFPAYIILRTPYSTPLYYNVESRALTGRARVQDWDLACRQASHTPPETENGIQRNGSGLMDGFLYALLYAPISGFLFFKSFMHVQSDTPRRMNVFELHQQRAIKVFRCLLLYLGSFRSLFCLRFTGRPERDFPLKPTRTTKQQHLPW